MSDDPLMKALSVLAQEESQTDARLEALVRGTASETELRLLEAEAAEDPALAEALEAYRPLDRPDTERIAAAAVAAFQDDAHAPNVIPFKRRTFMAVATIGAVAAASALFMLRPPPAGPALPTYALEIIGHDQVDRREHIEPVDPTEPKVNVLSPTSKVVLRLRPSVGTAESATAVAFFIHDGQAYDVAGTFTVSKEGTFTLEGKAGALFAGRTGPVEVVLAVGYVGRLPTRDKIIEAKTDAIDDVQILVGRLELTALD